MEAGEASAGDWNMSEDRSLIHRVVTCENDHEVCDIVVEPVRGTAAHTNVFSNWREKQAEPERASRVDESARCGVCDAPWARTAHAGGVALHIKDFGWTDS